MTTDNFNIHHLVCADAEKSVSPMVTKGLSPSVASSGLLLFLETSGILRNILKIFQAGFDNY